MSVSDVKRRGFSSPTRRNLLMGLLFVSPWLIGFVVWTVYPLVASVYYSFQRYDLLRPPTFVGAKNYIDILTTDQKFLLVTYNTFIYVILGIPLGLVTAFLMASLLNTRIVGRSIFRAIFFFPSIVPGVVVAVVWQFLLNPQFGAINGTLRALGLPVIPFITAPQYAKPTLIMINMWAQGSAIVIFLATLQEVPRSLYEAATVDGANGWHKFWHITIPMCTPVILFQLVMGYIWGFQEFTLPWLLTEGGPNEATYFYALYLYNNAFRFLRMGKASALAWILFIIVLVFTVILFKSSARWVYYGGSEE